MTNFTDERIAECKARCEAVETDRDAVAAFQDLPDALDALVEARRERDELQARVDSWHEPPLLDVHAICDQRDKAVRERDEAEALLLRFTETSQNSTGFFRADVETLLRKRGLLKDGQ